MVVIALSLASCTELDMQGVDPKEFYAVNPIKNKVETRYEMHTAHFPAGTDRLASDDIQALRSGLRGISPLAVESVQLHVHPSQTKNTKRREHITKLLRTMGYPGDAVMVEPSETLEANDVQIHIAYAAVVSPHCPDWRTSPVTTYSNTRQGNIGCASVTNLGLMVADPRDLERGDGATTPDSARNAKVIQDYHSGKDFNTLGATTPGGTSSPISGAEPAPAQ